MIAKGFTTFVIRFFDSICFCSDTPSAMDNLLFLLFWMLLHFLETKRFLRRSYIYSHVNCFHITNYYLLPTIQLISKIEYLKLLLNRWNVESSTVNCWTVELLNCWTDEALNCWIVELFASFDLDFDFPFSETGYCFGCDCWSVWSL